MFLFVYFWFKVYIGSLNFLFVSLVFLNMILRKYFLRILRIKNFVVGKNEKVGDMFVDIVLFVGRY